MPSLQSRRPRRKPITLSLVVSPQWLAGASSATEEGGALGGSVTDTADATARWNRVRAATNALFEVRGALPEEVTCPYTGARVRTDKGGGTVPKKSAFACGVCGTVQDVLTAVKATGKTGPVAAYGVQGYCHACDAEKQPYGGRFFAPVTDTRHIDAAAAEWEQRQASDLSAWRPESVLPYRLHDPQVERRDSQPWVHALVDHVQCSATTGTHSVAPRNRRDRTTGRNPPLGIP